MSDYFFEKIFAGDDVVVRDNFGAPILVVYEPRHPANIDLAMALALSAARMPIALETARQSILLGADLGYPRRPKEASPSLEDHIHALFDALPPPLPPPPPPRPYGSREHPISIFNLSPVCPFTLPDAFMCKFPEPPKETHSYGTHRLPRWQRPGGV